MEFKNIMIPAFDLNQAAPSLSAFFSFGIDALCWGLLFGTIVGLVRPGRAKQTTE